MSDSQPSNKVKFSVEVLPHDTRKYYRDNEGIQREIWRPGDGDGQPNTGRARGDITLQWRFYQGSANTEPVVPKNVMLDDEALLTVIACKAYSKAEMGRSWELDFSRSKGTVIGTRPNRGRPAWLPGQGPGDLETTVAERTNLVESVNITRTGTKTYPLTGEPRGFTAYTYLAADIQPQLRAVAVPTESTKDGSAGIPSLKRASIAPKAVYIGGHAGGMQLSQGVTTTAGQKRKAAAPSDSEEEDESEDEE